MNADDQSEKCVAEPTPAIAEPSWPRSDGGRIIFLLDAASRLEERVLRDWIDRERPADHSAPNIETVALPSSRRPRRSRLGPLKAALSVADDAQLVPLRVAWLPPARGGDRSVRLSHALLLGDPRDPSRLRASWIRAWQPDRCQVVVADSASVSELRERWRVAAGRDVVENMGLDRYVARQAVRRLGKR